MDITIKETINPEIQLFTETYENGQIKYSIQYDKSGDNYCKCGCANKEMIL